MWVADTKCHQAMLIFICFGINALLVGLLVGSGHSFEFAFYFNLVVMCLNGVVVIGKLKK